jgi:hypothetical protein
MAYSEKQRKEIVDFVCNEIAEGKSLRFVLSNNDNMPARNTFLEWIDNDTKKSNQYARAMELRQETIFEDILNIADNQEEDVLINDDGVAMTNHNVIQRARLRVDSRKWMLGKMNPKKYGDKLETDNKHSGTIEIVRHVKK